MRTLILKLLDHRCHSIHLRLLIGDNIGCERKDFRLLSRARYGEKIVYHNQRAVVVLDHALEPEPIDRKSTRLNSSHTVISYAVFCLKKKKKITKTKQTYIR